MENMEWVIHESTNEGRYFEVIEKTTVRRREGDGSEDSEELKTILANNPITDLTHKYFEVRFRERKKPSIAFAIGLASKTIKGDEWRGYEVYDPAVVFHCLNGRISLWDSNHSVKGTDYDEFSFTDVIGCGIGNDGRHFFTRNGKLMDHKNFDVGHGRCVYPLITLDGDTDTEVITNFGQEEFLYQQPKTLWNEWSNKLLRAKQSGDQLFLPSFNDFTIISKDGEEIGCHGLVLAIRSTVLLEKIDSGNEKRIQLDYDAKVIKLIIDFMYTDSIDCFEDLDNTVISDLLQIADDLKVQELRNVFFNQFKAKIDYENAMNLWNLAYQAKHDEGLKASGKFIFNNWDKCKGVVESMIEKDKEAGNQLFVFFSGLDKKNEMIRKQVLSMLNA